MAIPVPGGKEAQATFVAFGGLDTKASRSAIAENDFSWIENFIPLGPQNMRTLYAQGAAIHTASATIVFEFPFNLGGASYVAVFKSDGTATQVRLSDGAQTTISAVGGTFYNGGELPACAQSQGKYLLIVARHSANGYWIWDGTALFRAGTLAPDVTVVNGGRDYSSPPTVTAYGGSGSGAAFAAEIANGAVSRIVCTNPGIGYSLNDQPVLAISGGGSDDGAAVSPVVNSASSGIERVDIISTGEGYEVPVTLSLTGGGAGSGAAASVTGVSFGHITEITVTNPGSGYVSPPIVNIIPNGPGSGVVAVATIVAGEVTAITVVNGGNGYFFVPTIELVNVDPAELVVTGLVNGQITEVTVINPGRGYVTAPTISASGGAGTGFEAVVFLRAGQITAITIHDGGTGYVVPPEILIVGDGSGAVARATVSAGAINGFEIASAGLGYTFARAIVGAGNDAATAQASLMPFGVKGNTIESEFQRVWIGDVDKFVHTAPASLSNFAASAGGGAQPATDSYLRRAIIRMIANTGFLYIWGDSSVKVISNVNTSGVPPTTTFNNSGVDTQIGGVWRDTIIPFQRALMAANPTGIYALHGGAVEKVSDPLDKLFEKADFSFTPSAAVATVFKTLVYCFLFKTTDPFTQTQRVIMACWTGQRWFIYAPPIALTQIATHEVDSTLTAYGVAGTQIVPLFVTPSASMTKVYQSKLRDDASIIAVKQANMASLLARSETGTATFELSVDSELVTGDFLTVPGTFGAVEAPINFSVDANEKEISNYGALLGMTIRTTAPDATVIKSGYTWQEYAPHS